MWLLFIVVILDYDPDNKSFNRADSLVNLTHKLKDKARYTHYILLTYIRYFLINSRVDS